MLEGALSGTGLTFESCEHTFDKTKLPEWDKRVGKVYTCSKCGKKLCAGLKPVSHNARVRVSKKDRKRLKMLDQAVREDSNV